MLLTLFFRSSLDVRCRGRTPQSAWLVRTCLWPAHRPACSGSCPAECNVRSSSATPHVHSGRPACARSPKFCSDLPEGGNKGSRVAQHSIRDGLPLIRRCRSGGDRGPGAECALRRLGEWLVCREELVAGAAA